MRINSKIMHKKNVSTQLMLVWSFWNGWGKVCHQNYLVYDLTKVSHSIALLRRKSFMIAATYFLFLITDILHQFPSK